MKLKYRIIALLIGAITVTSCNDWLDIVQEGTIPTEDIDFTDLSQMYAPTSGVYATARLKMSQWEIWPLLNLRGDEVTKGGGSTADQAGYLDIENFNYDAAKGFWALNSTWEAFYTLIYTTYNNQELLSRFKENISSDADAQLAKEYEAEIIFHRALSYFFISNLWGDVPLIDAEDVNFGYPYKSSVETVRVFIHEELDICIADLPATQGVHPGAVTKYTAMALKAKLALIEGNYALVKSLTNTIITEADLELYDDYYNLFKIPGKLAPESLYEFQFTDFGVGDGQEVYGGAWFQHQGPNGGAAPIAGWGFMLIESEHQQFMKDRNEGVRWDVAIMESGKTTPAGDDIPLFAPDYLNGEAAHYNGKPYLPSNQMTAGRIEYGSNNNIRVLRYADVLLMNAEANLREGGDVATPFNLVRVRAGLDEIVSPTIEDILDERKAELSVEWGDRFNDLVRTDLASSTLEGFVKGEHEFLPIPTTQEDLNPNLLEPTQD